MVVGSNPTGRTMNNQLPTIDWSDEQIMEAAKQLKVGYKLKRTLRYASERDENIHTESVAEHVFALFYLAQYFLPIEDPEKKLDVEKLYRMLIFHDFGEITHGDIPYHIKTEAHEKQERIDAKEVFASLPPHIQKDAFDVWHEYEERQTPEAKFANALDKIEPMFELLDPVSETSLKRTKFTYDVHMGKKLKAMEHFPIMLKFVKVVSGEMNSRGVFWKEE